MKPLLPSPLPLNWPMKPLVSARTNFSVMPYGSYELTIEHELIRHVTPTMLLWWFRHIGGTMTVETHTYPRYRIWHPLDHIHWSMTNPGPDGAAQVGSRFRIVEAFGCNPDHFVDSVEAVVKLDIEGIRLVRRELGQEVFSLQHWFETASGGTHYRSRMQVGAENTFGQYLLNPLIHRFLFTPAMGHAWLKHNVEEVGNFEHFLPNLYQQQLHIEPVG
ncbi:hypothetical protein EXU85_26165 [Spirosoma sp. KCTC 42546]|uniref:DAPG hydrolase family protein n=1 Tax=Spirosoma sp. KCTC 42546 TaxID=2520506 RepID=UPI00115A5005|nr:hypothetical protein [Spirosoma sp. KCTC 42546]QDK81904.1 hypothetical protein EXU85_26165 [Spirosoma sp. KCTC 42546]